MFDKFQIFLILLLFISGIIQLIECRKIKKTKEFKKRSTNMLDVERLSPADKEQYLNFLCKQLYLNSAITLLIAIVMLLNIFIDIEIIFNVAFIIYLIVIFGSMFKGLSKISEFEKKYIC